MVTAIIASAIIGSVGEVIKGNIARDTEIKRRDAINTGTEASIKTELDTLKSVEDVLSGAQELIIEPLDEGFEQALSYQLPLIERGKLASEQFFEAVSKIQTDVQGLKNFRFEDTPEFLEQKAQTIKDVSQAAAAAGKARSEVGIKEFTIPALKELRQTESQNQYNKALQNIQLQQGSANMFQPAIAAGERASGIASNIAGQRGQSVSGVNQNIQFAIGEQKGITGRRISDIQRGQATSMSESIGREGEAAIGTVEGITNQITNLQEQLAKLKGGGQ